MDLVGKTSVERLNEFCTRSLLKIQFCGLFRSLILITGSGMARHHVLTFLRRLGLGLKTLEKAGFRIKTFLEESRVIRNRINQGFF